MSDDNLAQGSNPRSARGRCAALVTAVAIAAVAWMSLIAGASVVGGAMSLFTGRAEELPKWNGFDYLFFCAKEGGMLGGICATPVAVVIFLLAWATSAVRRSDR